VTRYRLNRGGDRQLNRALRTILLVRLQIDPDTRAHIARRTAEGKSQRDAKRRLRCVIAVAPIASVRSQLGRRGTLCEQLVSFRSVPDAERLATDLVAGLEWRPGSSSGRELGGLDRSPSVLTLWDDGHRLWPTLGILLDPVRHPLTSRKGAAPGHKYRGKVDEGIPPTVVWGDEAVPRDLIEFPDDSGLPLT
jgi:hypothetical protein